MFLSIAIASVAAFLVFGFFGSRLSGAWEIPPYNEGAEEKQTGVEYSLPTSTDQVDSLQLRRSRQEERRKQVRENFQKRQELDEERREMRGNDTEIIRSREEGRWEKRRHGFELRRTREAEREEQRYQDLKLRRQREKERWTTYREREELPYYGP